MLPRDKLVKRPLRNALLPLDCRALPTNDDDRSKNQFVLLMSLNMLIETDGGFDYTAADCQAG